MESMALHVSQSIVRCPENATKWGDPGSYMPNLIPVDDSFLRKNKGSGIVSGRK